VRTVEEEEDAEVVRIVLPVVLAGTDWLLVTLGEDRSV
jgi:hypothetical protein